MKIIFFSLFLVCFSGYCHAENWFTNVLKPSADAEGDQNNNTGVEGKIFNAKKLTVELKNINDIGMIFVIDESGGIEEAGSTEQTLGIAGTETIELEPYLKTGRNLLIFALWNKDGKKLDLKYWQKSFLEGYSYDYSLIGDGTTLYKLQGNKKTGGAGVVYWNAFTIDKDGDNLTIRPAPRGEIERIKRAMSHASTTTALTTSDAKMANITSNIAIALRLAD
jgi:hypothetical protein